MRRMQKTTAQFSNYSGESALPAPAGKLSQFNRTVTLKVVNATNADATYVLFGYNQYGDAQNAGSDTGVTITSSQSSHAWLKRESNTNGYVLLSCKLRTTDEDQFSEDIEFSLKDATGLVHTETITPDQYNEPENNQTKFLRIDDFNGMTIDGHCSITGTVLEGVTLTFIITIQSKVRLVDAAKDESVVRSTNQPAPNGAAPVRIEAVPGRMA